MDNTAKFWDKSAEKYGKSPIKNEALYHKKLEITRGYFEAGSEVFEFGCGTGTTAIAHAPYVKHIVAVDISAKMLEIAKGKAEAEGVENITFDKSTIEEFSAPEQSFDVVMAHNILHLLENPEEAMAKVYKLLKPGGAFVTSTACLGSSISFWRILIPIARIFGAVPYVNILSREELYQYFVNAGFEIDFQQERRKGEAAFIIAKKPVKSD